jgi:ABC-type multidrug transport system fused ATPase/permease subunit
LFAGIAYAFAYFILRLNSDYYYLPSIILFLPSLVHWIKYLFLKKRAFAVTLFIILLPLYSYNSFQTAARIRGIWRERQEFMPYITSLLSDYNNGKKFIWYESDNKTTDGTFYITVRDWRKYIENAFLNYLNKSEGMDFFVSEKRLDHTIFYQNTLFFYPVDNDQWQPMRDELVKTLKDNNFALYKDSYGVLIYKQY